MAKPTKNQYVCSDCGGVSAKWSGQCPNCQSWNTLIETAPEKASSNRFSALAPTAPVQALSEIHAQDVPRFSSELPEFDRVLGGGLVSGGVILIGGDPGIGKSTLLLQSLAMLSKTRSVLYVSGEESGAQIALRAQHCDPPQRNGHAQPADARDDAHRAPPGNCALDSRVQQPQHWSRRDHQNRRRVDGAA